MSINITKVVTTEDDYAVVSNSMTQENIVKGLQDGSLNILPSAIHEQDRWVINKSGRRVAILRHMGGGDSEDVTLKARKY